MKNLPKISIDESTKEVFFHIGLTFYAAQSFEECLLGMLVGLYITENPVEWQKNYLQETKNLNTLPLGRLLEKARKSITFDHEIDSTLQLALKNRNRFIHHFYYESFSLLSDPRGHKRVIEEVIQLRHLFRKADDMIAPLSYQLMIKAGMTEDQISMHAHNAVKVQLHEKGVE